MFDIRMLVLAVIATLIPKALAFVRCPKVDWPHYYVCLDDKYCCEVEQCCDHFSIGAIMGISFGVFSFVCIVMFCCFIKHAKRGDIHPSNVHGWVESPKYDWPYYYVCFNDHDCCEYERCCERPSSSTSSTRHGAVERSSRGRINVILETVIPFIVFCIIVIVCFQCCKHSREGVIHPSHGQQAAVVHISQCAERTTEQTTRIEQPDPITHFHKPASESTSSSRQQRTTTLTIVNPSAPHGPMYGHDSHSNLSPPPSYTSEPKYSPPPPTHHIL